VALELRAKVDKNKVGLPLREVGFNLEFGYGINDLASCVDWLKEVGHLADLKIGEKEAGKFVRSINNMSDDDAYKMLNDVQRCVRKRWSEIETSFLPKRQKYANLEVLHGP